MTEPRHDTAHEIDPKALASVRRGYAAGSDVDGPPAAIDDAVRAAARRAVHSGPRAAGRAWMGRSSAPLAVAAVLVLTVSIGFLSLDREEVQVGSRAELPVRPGADAMSAGPTLSQAPKQEAANSSKSAPGADPFNRPAVQAKDSAAVPALAPAPVSAPPPPPPPAPALRPDARQLTPDRAAPAPVAKEKFVAAPPPATLSAEPATPTPSAPAAPIPSPAAPKREVLLESSAAAPAPASKPALQPQAIAPQMAQQSMAAQTAPQASMADANRARSDAAPATAVARKAAAAPMAESAPAESSRAEAAPSSAEMENPEAWIKRILDLRKGGRTKEAEAELTQFRKRYPAFALPVELRQAQ